jgi:deoxycytidine triphosphate deaminase
MNEINVELQKLLLALEYLENKANKSKSNKIEEKEKSKIDLNVKNEFLVIRNKVKGLIDNIEKKIQK